MRESLLAGTPRELDQRGCAGEELARVLALLPRLRQPIRSRVADDHAVDEILSDVQLTAWRRLHDVPADDSGAHRWLWRVAHNSILNHVRGKVRRRRLSERMSNQPVDSWVVYPVELDRVVAFEGLDSLTTGDRQLVAWVLEGRTHHEMATALALTPGALAMRLLRVRGRLDDALS